MWLNTVLWLLRTPRCGATSCSMDMSQPLSLVAPRETTPCLPVYIGQAYCSSTLPGRQQISVWCTLSSWLCRNMFFFLHVRHTTAFSWPVWSFCFVQYIRPPHFNSYLWEFLFVVVVVVVGSICVLFVINVSRKLPWGPNSAFKPTYNTDRMVLCENLGLKACEWMCAVKVWSLSMSEESCLGLDYSCTCKWGAVAEASKATLKVGTDFYVRLYCPRLRMSKNKA